MDPVKELVRAAQEAEVRGEHARAVELLRRAEAQYRTQGSGGRADKLARHAARLEETIAGTSKPADLVGRELASSTGRGPVSAPSELEAWCSFCCRPKSEVGPLVTGPTDAFICRACAAESLRLSS